MAINQSAILTDKFRKQRLSLIHNPNVGFCWFYPILFIFSYLYTDFIISTFSTYSLQFFMICEVTSQFLAEHTIVFRHPAFFWYQYILILHIFQQSKSIYFSTIVMSHHTKHD